jgi:hypothetical protein
MKRIIRLTESDLTRIVRRVIQEQDDMTTLTESETPTDKKNLTVKSKISTDGIKNVTTEMINQDYSFPGEYHNYVLEGSFKNVDYVWDGTDVPGMPYEAGYAFGWVLTDYNSILPEMGITDADPTGTWVGFNGSGLKFACYKSKQGSVKCSKFE